ncbi:hypothetical protein GWG65_25165 [Bradyrhizobium sp. CSA207]|uniref:hypothetical protein n=1 Tax=Bradyrhizobium sp. CSA207 TaxID=2698826 RepID=UPI0023B0F0E1|nr:hypothetical protein [Bradyrhizobium sp. CSA207]MDE5444680.1 hypothetical protein [Bradyrhizobium sp. CSA207]
MTVASGPVEALELFDQMTDERSKEVSLHDVDPEVLRRALSVEERAAVIGGFFDIR